MWLSNVQQADYLLLVLSILSIMLMFALRLERDEVNSLEKELDVIKGKHERASHHVNQAKKIIAARELTIKNKDMQINAIKRHINSTWKNKTLYISAEDLKFNRYAKAKKLHPKNIYRCMDVQEMLRFETEKLKKMLVRDIVDNVSTSAIKTPEGYYHIEVSVFVAKPRETYV